MKIQSNSLKPQQNSLVSLNPALASLRSSTWTWVQCNEHILKSNQEPSYHYQPALFFFYENPLHKMCRYFYFIVTLKEVTLWVPDEQFTDVMTNSLPEVGLRKEVKDHAVFYVHYLWILLFTVSAPCFHIDPVRSKVWECGFQRDREGQEDTFRLLYKHVKGRVKRVWKPDWM